MTVMELAAELGKAIKEHEVYKKYLEAKEAYDTNDALNRKIMEYSVQQKALADEAGKQGMQQVYSFSSNEEAVAYLKTILTTGDVVLVKGSRGMHTEEIVKAFL